VAINPIPGKVERLKRFALIVELNISSLSLKESYPSFVLDLALPLTLIAVLVLIFGKEVRKL